MKENPLNYQSDTGSSDLPGFGFGLGFLDPQLEKHYRDDHIRHKLPFIRNITLIAAFLFVVYSILDWINIDEMSLTLWQVRIPVILFFLVLYAISYTSFGKRNFFGLVLTALLVTTLSLTFMMLLVPEEHQKWFFSAYIMVIISSFEFSGNRFFYGCISVLMIMLIANISGLFIKLPVNELITHNFFLVTASLITTISGYMQEKQRRQLFYQAYVMDKARQKSDHSARHDNLTGLPNRHDLQARIEEAITSAQIQQKQIAIVFVDLNDFKPINDKYGHRVGDLVLKIVAERLQRGVRRSDTVIRYGGDEFLIILNDSINNTYIKRVLDQIDKRLAAPVYLEVNQKNMNFSLAASTGVALYPDNGTTPESLIHFADKAMYDAKQYKIRSIEI